MWISKKQYEKIKQCIGVFVEVKELLRRVDALERTTMLNERADALEQAALRNAEEKSRFKIGDKVRAWGEIHTITGRKAHKTNDGYGMTYSLFTGSEIVNDILPFQLELAEVQDEQRSDS
jgi:hypothetical protein